MATNTSVDSFSDEERQFLRLAEEAPVMIWRSNLDKRCDYFNRKWRDFTGRSLEEETGLGWTRGIAERDYQRCSDAFKAAHSARSPFALDYHLRRHDGVHRWMLSNGVPYLRAGRFAGFLGSCIDISSHHVSDEDGVSVSEEDTVRELNHRLKNSLQTSICFSALGRPLGDRGTQQDLSSITERLSLLALPHEKLGYFGGKTESAFSLYLESLARSVHAAIGRSHISLAVACEPMVVGAKRASAIGAIFNELLAAALKRFPDGATGSVKVAARQLAGHRIEVTIFDDSRNDILAEQRRHGSFQRQLIERLVAHAGGTIRYVLDGGTRCVITLESE